MTGPVFVDTDVLAYRADASDPVKLRDRLAPGEMVPVPDWQRDLIRERLAALDRVLPEDRSVHWEVCIRKRVFTRQEVTLSSSGPFDGARKTPRVDDLLRGRTSRRPMQLGSRPEAAFRTRSTSLQET